MSRTLIHVPVIHDMFSELGLERKKEFLEGYLVKMYLKELDLFWDGIEKKAEDRKIDRIYLDGFSDREKNLGDYYEKKGLSRNLDLVLKLESEGAELMKTENSKAILLYCYVRIEEPAAVPHLLAYRDECISKEINQTLLSGETGILFLGMDHNIESILKKHKDLEVESWNDISELFSSLSEVVYHDYKKLYGDPLDKAKLKKSL